MLAYLYQVCLIVFLLQGITLPFLPLVSGVLWWRRSRRLELLGKEVERARRKKLKADKGLESMLKGLPVLRPLKCANCGGSLLLLESETLCPYCGTPGVLPKDYGAAVRLKSEVRRLLRSAIRHWRVANVLTHPFVRWGLFLMIFVEPLVLFPAVVIGSNVYPDTGLDRAFGELGMVGGTLLMISSFFGFIIWMVVFILLASLCRSLRRKLPVVPVFEGESRGRTAASCQACGGGIEYEAGAFACLCDYCNVENYRARFVRRARALSEEQRMRTKSVLFGAEEIIEDFVGTLFFTTLILVGAAAVLTAFYALNNLLY